MITTQRDNFLIVLGIILSLFAIFYNMEDVSNNISNHYHFNDDARQQIAPFFALEPDGSTAHDYEAKYYRTVISPLGIKAIYQTAAQFSQVETVSKILPYILYALFLATLYYTALPFGNRLTAWTSVLLGLILITFLDRMIGGLARAFGFPLIMLGIFCVTRKKLYLLALLTVISAFFYPIAAVICGTALLFETVVLPRTKQCTLTTRPLIDRLIFLAIIATLTALPLIPQFLHSQTYGERITIDDVALYPEAGEGGRYAFDEDRPPFNNILMQVVSNLYKTLSPSGVSIISLDKTLISAMHLIVFLGSTMLPGMIRRRKRWGVKLGGFLLTIAVCHTAALLMFPYFYMPPRYTLYSAPIILILLLPVALHQVLKKSTGKYYTFYYCALVVLSFTFYFGKGNADIGYAIQIKDHHKLYEYVSTLPRNATIAGWPSEETDNIPYLSKRTAYVTYEYHQALHTDYALEMRRRMSLFLKAYFSHDIDILKSLYNDGVTHLIVNLEHFKPHAKPVYFKPFNEQIKLLRQAEKEAPYLLPMLANKAASFKDENLAVLNLSQLFSGK